MNKLNDEICPECKCRPPGHKIDCKTGNERARRYQQQLSAKYIAGRRGGKQHKSSMNYPDEPKGPGRPPLPDDERASSQIQLRVTRKRKAAYVRASQPGTLADWMFRVCDEASGYRGK